MNCAAALCFSAACEKKQLPSSYARGAGRQAGVVGMQVTERETIARPLAPPDVGSLSSEDDSDPEEEEEEQEQEEEEDDEEVVAEAVDNLLLDIEVSLSPLPPSLPVMIFFPAAENHPL